MAQQSVAELDALIEDAETHLEALRARRQALVDVGRAESSSHRRFGVGQLTKEDVERFSRQMLCEDLGPLGTRRLREARVLVVGAGGLGSTVCLYLAAAGVGELTIVDFDVVERSNLHRQIIHNDGRVGQFKSVSARASCLALNPHMTVHARTDRFDADNAEALVRGCDVVVDASDNVAARYLINDAAVVCNKPLVSGSAMRWEGQLTVYDRGATTPCYRCVFPKAPPQDAVGSCNDSGVIGPVPGAIGCLQALEAIKVIAQCGQSLAGRMLLWNGLTSVFKTIKLRPRQEGCAVCGANATILSPLADANREEYQMLPCLNALTSLGAHNRAAPSALLTEDAVVVDVRESLQHAMCPLEGSVSMPLSRLAREVDGNKRLSMLHTTLRTRKRTRTHTAEVGDAHDHDGGIDEPLEDRDVYVVCRRGIASTQAVAMLVEAQQQAPEDHPCRSVRLKSIDGGITRYGAECDLGFPSY